MVVVLCQPFDVYDLPLLYFLFLFVSNFHLPLKSYLPHPITRKILTELTYQNIELFKAVIQSLLSNSLKFDHFF